MSWLVAPLAFTLACSVLMLIEPESKGLIFAVWCYLIAPVLIANWSF